MTTCWTCSGATSARSSAALIAMPPSSVASSGARPPPSLPIGRAGGCRGSRSWAWWRSPRSQTIDVDCMAACRWYPRRAMRVRATTDAPPTRAPTRSSSGCFEDEGDRPRLTAGRSRRWWTPARPAPGCASWRSRTPRGGAASLVGLGAARRVRRRARARGRRGRRRAARGELGARVLCWEVPHHVDDDVAAALVEGTVLAAYRFDRYKQRLRRRVAGIERAGRLRPPRRRARRSSAARVAGRGAATPPATSRTRPPTT